MTQPPDAPLTRRALRAAAAAAATAAAPLPDVRTVTAPLAPAPPQPDDVPLTRRAIREAERARERTATALPAPQEAPPVESFRAGVGAGPGAPVLPAQQPAPSIEVVAPVALARRAAAPTRAQAARPAPAPVSSGSSRDTTGERPLTRRELRMAAEEAERRRRLEALPTICRPPFAATLVVPAQQVRTSQARAVVSRLGARPLAVIALSVCVLVGGVTQVHAEQQQVAAQEAAAAAERVERAQRTEAARYAAKAAAVAAERREEALAVAEAVVDTAKQVRKRTAEVVDPETLASLEAATAELTALLETAPAVEALSVATGVTLEDAAPATPDDPVQQEGVEVTAATPPPTTEDAPAEASTDDAAPQATAHALRSGRASRTLVPGEGRVRQLATDRVAAHALGTSDPTVVREQLAALDLDTSTRILEAATEVSELSARVEAVADALLADLEAQRAAEEAERRAAEEAARKAAEERARKIAVAESSPNGEIPSDVLCGVAFQDGVLLRCDAAEALEALNEAYRAAFGQDLRVVSSYRSYPAQIETRRSRGYLAARPGTSNHGRAIAVDLGDFGGVGDFSHPNHRWVREHGPAFGWHHPEIMRPGGGGPQEPWHFEYQG